MEKIEWNLDQALTWVVWRNFDLVESLRTRQYQTTTFGTLLWNDEAEFLKNGVKVELTKHDISDSLLAAFRDGRVKARGVKGAKGDRICIPVENWLDLYIQSIPLQQSIAMPTHETGSKWVDIVLNVSEVMAAFPSGKSNKDERDSELKRKIHAATLFYCMSEKPEIKRGWKAAANEHLCNLLEFKGIKPSTIKKYSKDALCEYGDKK